jgi:hypothetical protein
MLSLHTISKIFVHLGAAPVRCAIGGFSFNAKKERELTLSVISRIKEYTVLVRR